MKKILFAFSLLLFLSACQQSNRITNISTPPVLVEKDKALADVYQMLDGQWEGTFNILEDANRVAKSARPLVDLSLEQLESYRLKTINSIQVRQEYSSESPYFQRVVISDYYPDTQKRVESKGVNKVQNGEMWCVVQKPDELIVHKGSLKDAQTIIWQSQQEAPQKIEYFQERVSEKYYEIIGYGYYDGDDTDLSPRLWFYGKYERQ